MRPRQPLPRLWLMTDERMGEALWHALARLPRGSGIVFRHHATPPAPRRLLYERVRRIARARRLVLVLAGSPRAAVGWRADGAHGRSPHQHAARGLVRTAPAHGRREVIQRGHVNDALFLSPVFPTRSHPAGTTLGPIRFGLAAPRRRPAPTAISIIALGGMDSCRFKRMRRLGADGWAAIDAWMG